MKLQDLQEAKYAFPNYVLWAEEAFNTMTIDDLEPGWIKVFSKTITIEDIEPSQVDEQLTKKFGTPLKRLSNTAARWYWEAYRDDDVWAHEITLRYGDRYAGGTLTVRKWDLPDLKKSDLREAKYAFPNYADWVQNIFDNEGAGRTKIETSVDQALKQLTQRFGPPTNQYETYYHWHITSNNQIYSITLSMRRLLSAIKVATTN